MPTELSSNSIEVQTSIASLSQSLSASAATQTAVPTASRATNTDEKKSEASSVPSAPPARPMVGVAVLLTCPAFPGSVLVGKRISSHGSGTIQLPGGHLEFGESWEDCGSRELLEETNLNIAKSDLKLAHVTNDVFKSENKHYITLFMQGVVSADEAKNVQTMEPHKCSGWEWRRWEDLKQTQENLFLPLKAALDQGFNPFK